MFFWLTVVPGLTRNQTRPSVVPGLTRDPEAEKIGSWIPDTVRCARSSGMTNQKESQFRDHEESKKDRTGEGAV